VGPVDVVAAALAAPVELVPVVDVAKVVDGLTADELDVGLVVDEELFVVDELAAFAEASPDVVPKPIRLLSKSNTV